MKVRPARYFGKANGRHRAQPPAVPAPLAPQQFVHCTPCGVETAATRHGNMLRCAEGHLQPAGGAA